VKIQDAIVLVTGANRGIGLAFAKALPARGARKVYAAARDPATITLPGVVPVRLDITKPDQVAAAAALCADATIIINNAGIAKPGGPLDPDGVESLRAHLETNFFGILHVSRAFAPVLARNGGGALLNVLSIVSWVSSSVIGNYAASKSAAWGLTNALRLQLRDQKTQVLGLHMGFVDTDLTKGFDLPKSPPEVIVAAALDGLEAGKEEVLADELTRTVKPGLAAAEPFYLRNIRE
jgi:NAD(P)-dependent dehydrogenase (short-subunit alcohol dehydrogenase family)